MTQMTHTQMTHMTHMTPFSNVRSLTRAVALPQQAGSRTKILAGKRQDAANAHGRMYALPKRTLRDWLALAGLLVLACAIFFVNLTASGYANEFYAAAAQAGSTSWESFLWGSLDSGNAITVDKPPASIWVMALSVRLFGLSSLSILLPEALMGVATTFMLYATVRRYWGNWTAIAAGAIFALTPVAALMFRFDNPDALLVLLMTISAYAVLRAMEYDTSHAGARRRTAWMVLAGILIGLGFLTKQLQVMLVLPGFAVAFLIASPSRPLRRVVDGLIAVAAACVSAGWWVLLTVLVPANMRPYFAGSQHNSFIELTFGYNGFGRLTGSEEGSVVAGGSRNGGMWGQTGLSRLFDGIYGTQIAWLAPLAFSGIVIGLVVVGRAVRIDLRRASIVVFTGWLVTTWLVFSFMAGIFHQYYTVALAPALAVLAAVGCTGLWVARERLWMRVATPLLILLQSWWSFTLIGRAQWLPWLKWAVLVAGIAAAILLIASWLIHVRLLAAAGSVLAAIALMAGPTAWTLYTVGTAHTGSIVTAGPEVSGSNGFGGGNGGGFTRGGFGQGGGQMSQGFSRGGRQGGSSQSQNNGGPSLGGNSTGGQQPPSSNGTEFSTRNRRGGTRSGGFGGGFLGSSTASAKITAMLSASTTRWAAATTGSQSAARYQLASQHAVIAIGGFNGSDPSPTFAQFKQYVSEGLIHYYISGGSDTRGRQLGGSDNASKIASWVSEHYKSQVVDGVTIYDLS